MANYPEKRMTKKTISQAEYQRIEKAARDEYNRTEMPAYAEYRKTVAPASK